MDIAGIDIYTNAWYGWGDFREDSFPKAFQITGQVQSVIFRRHLQQCLIIAGRRT